MSLDIAVGRTYNATVQGEKQVVVVTGAEADGLWPILVLSGSMVGRPYTLKAEAFLSEKTISANVGGGKAVLKERCDELLAKFPDKLCWWDVSNLDLEALDSVEKKLQSGTYERVAWFTNGDRNVPKGRYLCVDGIDSGRLYDFLMENGFHDTRDNIVQKREKKDKE